MQDANNVGLMLLDSVAKFKLRAISNDIGARAYLKAYSSTRGILTHPGTNFSIDSQLSCLVDLRYKAKEIPSTFSNIISGKKNYYLMAVNDAIDIVLSMDKRFVRLTREEPSEN